MSYLVVSGIRASGKSTLARQLGSALAVPVLDKDDILDGLFDSLGIGDPERRSTLSRSADDIVRQRASTLGAGILVSWWQHPHSVSPSGTPTSWLPTLSRDMLEIYCRARTRSALRVFFIVPFANHLGKPDECTARPRSKRAMAGCSRVDSELVRALSRDLPSPSRDAVAPPEPSIVVSRCEHAATPGGVASHRPGVFSTCTAALRLSRSLEPVAPRRAGDSVPTGTFPTGTAATVFGIVLCVSGTITQLIRRPPMDVDLTLRTGNGGFVVLGAALALVGLVLARPRGRPV